MSSDAVRPLFCFLSFITSFYSNTPYQQSALFSWYWHTEQQQSYGLAEPPSWMSSTPAWRSTSARVSLSASEMRSPAVASSVLRGSDRWPLKMPALVLWDDQDALFPSAVRLTLAVALLRAQFTVLQGFGHLLTLEKPAESTAILTKLLTPA